MNTGSRSMTTFRRLLPFALSLLILTAMLLVVNVYQYWRMKREISATVVKAVNDTELKRLQVFLEDIEKKLNIVREWGRSGLLTDKPVEDLNRQFLPLLQHAQELSGLLMADNQGREYYLGRDGEGFLVREVVQEQDGANLRFRQLDGTGKPGAAWQKRERYTPVQRPWFKSPEDLEIISWTKPYIFYQARQEGITASIGWENSDGRSGYTVFGIDILLSSIEQLLGDTGRPSQAVFFLVNLQGDAFLTSPLQEAGVSREDMAGVLADIRSDWEEAGRPARTLTAVRYSGQKWLASMQPLLHQGRSLWIGVTVSEKNLLKHFNGRLYAIDLVDVVAMLLLSPLLLFYLWRSGAWRKVRSAPPSPAERLHNYISEGEGAGIEFKSSVRMNLRTGKQGKEIELAWLKAVVAFLNTNGGVLLIGVDDDGRIVGLEADGFENADRCLLHLKNLLHQHIGAEFSGLIDTTLVEAEEGWVAMLECRPATAPVFLQIGKNEEFYVRSGPSSAKLSPSQTLRHVMHNRS